MQLHTACFSKNLHFLYPAPIYWREWRKHIYKRFMSEFIFLPCHQNKRQGLRFTCPVSISSRNSSFSHCHFYEHCKLLPTVPLEWEPSHGSYFGQTHASNGSIFWKQLVKCGNNMNGFSSNYLELSWHEYVMSIEVLIYIVYSVIPCLMPNKIKESTKWGNQTWTPLKDNTIVLAFIAESD